MTKRQLAEGRQIMERLWAVEDTARSTADESVIAAAERAANDLDDLVREAGEGSELLELARTLRYLGDAHYSRSARRDETALQASREAYMRAAEVLTEELDAIEWARLQFHCANTTRLLGGEQDRDMLEEARDRYQLALGVFEREMPSAVGTVQTSLVTLEAALRALE